MQYMLAVDLGVKTGLALFTTEGQLIWYRSRNYGNKQRLKQDIQNFFDHTPAISLVILEGGGDLAQLWKKECRRRAVSCRQIYAEEWRKDLFDPKEYRTGEEAKKQALKQAREVIDHCNGPKPTSMIDDAAEAILIGYWTLKYATGNGITP
jgi:hypothetical protein